MDKGHDVWKFRGVEMMYESDSWDLTIWETMLFLEAYSWLGPPKSLARQLEDGGEVGASEGSSVLKEPSSSVVAIANFFTWLHFTRTLMPERS